LNKDLTFLGIGSAFSPEYDNTSAFYKDKDVFLLIDCGETITRKILKYNLLEGINKVLILITHLHADHVGSLEAFINYLHIFKKEIEYQIIYNDKNSLIKFLKLQGIDYEINIKEGPINIYNFYIEPIKQIHIEPSYGYIVKSFNFSFYYSGDTKIYHEKINELIIKNELDKIYHEVSIKNPLHISLESLIKHTKNIKQKVTVMHLYDKSLLELCIKEGFQKPILLKELSQ
jgi:ribonuclease BN (tRNA processing enzyme)